MSTLDNTTELRTAVYGLLHTIAPDKAPTDDAANDETSLESVLDSFDMFTLIQDLESTFNIQVSDDEAGSENLGSVAKIVAFVAKKRPM